MAPRRPSRHRGRSVALLLLLLLLLSLAMRSAYRYVSSFSTTLRFYRQPVPGAIANAASASEGASEASRSLLALRDAFVRGDIGSAETGSGVDGPPYDLLRCVTNCEAYRMRLRRGYRRMADSVGLVIAGIVKNNKNGAEHMIRIARKTCLFVARCHLVIYENDSTDGTAELLRAAADLASAERKSGGDGSAPPEITLVQETGVSERPYFSFGAGEKLARLRYSIMATLRNKLLSVVMDDARFRTYTHVAMVDFDLHGWSIDGVANSFGWEEPLEGEHELPGGAFDADPLWRVDLELAGDDGSSDASAASRGERQAGLPDPVVFDDGGASEANSSAARSIITQEERRAHGRRRRLAAWMPPSMNDTMLGHFVPAHVGASSSMRMVAWDAVAANGLKPRIGNWMNYYDTLAFVDIDGRTPRVPSGLWGQVLQRRERPRPMMLVGDGLVPVRSAFGGLAIYKRAALMRIAEKAASESGVTHTPNVTLAQAGAFGPYVGNRSEHVNLHERMRDAGMSMFVNPSMVVLAGDNCNSANRVSWYERAIFSIGCDGLHWSVVGL